MEHELSSPSKGQEKSSGLSQSFLERLRAATATNASELYDLYKTQGDSEAFNAVLI
jgi:hypothetical protein